MCDVYADIRRSNKSRRYFSQATIQQQWVPHLHGEGQKQKLTGSMYLGMRSAKSLQVLGAKSDGLMTTQFPAAIAPVTGANVS